MKLQRDRSSRLLHRQQPGLALVLCIHFDLTVTVTLNSQAAKLANGLECVHTAVTVIVALWLDNLVPVLLYHIHYYDHTVSTQSSNLVELHEPCDVDGH